VRRRIVQSRQFVQCAQAEIVEKLLGRGKKRGTAGHIAMPYDLNPAAILELLHDLRIHRDTANLFDVPPRYRLPIANDRERFKHGARVFWRLFGIQPIEITPHCGLALETPTRRQRHQFHATTRPILLQIFEQGANRIGRNIFGEKLAQFGELQWLLRADQGSLEDDFRLLRIHAAR